MKTEVELRNVVENCESKRGEDQSKQEIQTHAAFVNSLRKIENMTNSGYVKYYSTFSCWFDLVHSSSVLT